MYKRRRSEKTFLLFYFVFFVLRFPLRFFVFLLCSRGLFQWIFYFVYCGFRIPFIFQSIIQNEKKNLLFFRFLLMLLAISRNSQNLLLIPTTLPNKYLLFSFLSFFPTFFTFFSIIIIFFVLSSLYIVFYIIMVGIVISRRM